MKNTIDFDVKFEQVNCGEKPKQDLYNEYDSTLVDSKLRELKNSDEEILAAYSVEKMREAVNKKLDNKSESGFELVSAPAKKIKKTTLIRTFSFAAAAVLVAAFCVPQLTSRSKINQTVPVSDSTVRTKGNSKPSLQVYLQNGSEIVRMKDGDIAGQGSILQLSYQAGKDHYGMIFSVDGNGTVTQHFPVSGSRAGELTENKEVPLDFAYELDDAPDFERFYFVTSKKPFELMDLSEKQLKEKKLDYIQFVVRKK